jgi:hypothetical protein
VLKDFELIAIVSVQPVLRSKPDEALIVLHYLGYPRLRQSILGGESRETHTISVNHRHGNCVRVDMRLRHGANIDWATARQNNSVSGEALDVAPNNGATRAQQSAKPMITVGVIVR